MELAKLGVWQVVVGLFVILKECATEAITKVWETVVHFVQSYGECSKGLS